MENRKSSWTDLPPELLHLVFGQLSLPEVETVGSTCRAWEAAARPVLLARLQERIKQEEMEARKMDDSQRDLGLARLGALTALNDLGTQSDVSKLFCFCKKT